jgi:TonB family protein
MLLAACLLLPLQPWKQAAAAGTVQVTYGDDGRSQPVRHTSSGCTMPRSEMVLLLALGRNGHPVWLAGGWLLEIAPLPPPLPAARPGAHVERGGGLLVSEDIASPVTFGWRKPVVLLPAHFAELNARVQEAILCHEIMHVRRGDWLFTVAEELVRAIFWFHPAVWWLLGEIGLAREQAVDRLAIEITQEREHYMDALLAIAGARAQLDLAPAPLFLRKRHLRQRVILILQEARMSKARLISTLTTGLAVLVAACWLATGVFPLTAEPQEVNDAPGVTVFLSGSQVLHRTAVRYPRLALQRGVQGSVSVEVKLDSTGTVNDAHVLSGPDELRSAVLQSVLEWHFTRDAANSTRQVQISFELPAKGVSEGVVGGVPGGISGGVTGGVIGGVVGGVPEGAALNESQTRPPRIRAITVTGLSEQAGDELRALLPVHVEEDFTPEALQRLTDAVHAFDEHLIVRASRVPPNSVELQISTPEGSPSGGLLRTTATVPAIKVSGNVQSMMIVKKVPPVYPELAKSARVSGVVHLAAMIAKDGTIQELHSLGGPALLIQAAMDAVRQWVYKPTLLNGEPVAVETTIDVNFTLLQ